MTTALIFGLVMFIGVLAILLVFGPRPSAAAVLLTRVANEVRTRRQPADTQRKPFIDPEVLARMVAPFRKAFSARPGELLIRRLSLAGYRKPIHADIFLAVRLALPAFMGLVVALSLDDNVVIAFLMTIVAAFFVPDFWLTRQINKRRMAIQLSLPDGLDLLAICMEAGMGMDQGIVRVGQELRTTHPALSDEWLQINFEQRAGAPRIEAWKGFADRANVESVRSFVAMLIQTDRFGTPISKSLAAFSDALRVQRRQQAEEKAAKATIKLVPPLVFFIFPSVGIVLVGPAVITLIKNMAHLLH
jgi:tight adherence protein C